MHPLLLVLILAGNEQPLQSFRYQQQTHVVEANGVTYATSALPSLRFTAARLDLSRDFILRDSFGIPN